MTTDFGDWLSPMLVKELRQGMRSRVFMSAFYLTQLLMILSVVFNLAAATNTEMPAEMLAFLNGLFWLMISVPLLFVMPIRGFGALHGEIKAGTIELVFLTRLTAWRIAAGKWTALMAQTLLLLCAVLPYVLLRYFLGGVDILADLQSLLFLLLTCAVLTAATIAMSPYESKLLRALFVIGLIFGFQFLIGMMFAWMAVGRIAGAAGSSAPVWQLYLGVALYVPAFIALALEIAASRIAPPAENHAIRKRLIGLVIFLAAPVLTLFSPGREALYGASLLFLVPVIVDALAEPVVVLGSIYRPFLRRGSLGRIGALVFTPGWVSAAWYTALLALLGSAALAMQGQFADPLKALSYVAYFGALIFPAALIRLFLPSTKYFLGFYIAFQFFFAAVTLLVGMMAGISNQPMTRWLSPIPNCSYWLTLTSQVKPEQVTEFLVATSFVTAASLGILLLRTIPALRDIRAVLGQAARNHGPIGEASN